MGEFIHGWRRKAGCALLVIAAAFAGIWVRSLRIVDTFSFCPDDGPRHSLTLSPDGIEWHRKQGSGQYVVVPRFMNIGWESTDFLEDDFAESLNGWNIDWNWQWCGFQFGQFQLSGGGIPLSGDRVPVLRDQVLTLVLAETAIWKIPHWSFSPPLSLLSACLILWPGKRGTMGSATVEAT